jgi:hypothetical protein
MNTTSSRHHALVAPVLVATIGMFFYFGVLHMLTPHIQSLYKNNQAVIYAPTHFNDARQYVLICTQGYNVPHNILPTIQVSRFNWMPFYAWLQCAAHQLTGISMRYVGVLVSMVAIWVTLFFGALSLRNLGVAHASLNSLAALAPVVGGAWLYLPGAEATYLAAGMVVMWLITVPLPANPRPRDLWGELALAMAAAPAGFVLLLTKPNALAMLFPLAFAFVYLSWRRSCSAGYTHTFFAFAADLVIEHVLLVLPRRWREPRPMRYVWTPALAAAGILLGFTFWTAYTSLASGIPFYFLQQQLTVWGRAWPSGNLGEMLAYFAQAFNEPNPARRYRFNAAWNLAANLSALIPAASPRVPPLIRGMLPFMTLLLLYSGAVHGSDRYILSTALVAIGWACWLAPRVTARNPYAWRRWVVRWILLLMLALITSILLVFIMFPIGEPQAWGILDR